MQGSAVWQEFTSVPDLWDRIGPNAEAYDDKFRRLCTDPRVAEMPAVSEEGRQAMAGLTGWNWAGFLFGPYWAVWRGVRHGWIWLVAGMLTNIAAELNPSGFADVMAIVAGLGSMLYYALRGNALLLVRLSETLDEPARQARPSMLRLLASLGLMVVSAAVIVLRG